MGSVFDVTALLNDLLTWLTGLIPIGGAGMVAYHAFMKNSSGEEHAAQQHGRSIRNVLIGTGLGTGAVALINWAMTYVTLGGTPGTPPTP